MAKSSEMTNKIDVYLSLSPRSDNPILGRCIFRELKKPGKQTAAQISSYRKMIIICARTR
jgi:hypothetical protein